MCCMTQVQRIEKYPFQTWYEQTSSAQSVDDCDICQTILNSDIQMDVASAWADYNVYYEAAHAPDAIEYAEGGGDIFKWAKKHWMFNYSDLLPQGEYNDLISSIQNRGRFVHIGCGALPFTGIFFSRYFDRICLIDFDQGACDLARELLNALNIKNVEIYCMNGKDFPFEQNDTIMIASMVLDKTMIIQSASKAGTENLLLRSTDQRARGIFYNKDHEISATLNYDFQGRTNPPREIGNVTYWYQFQK